MEKDEPKDDPGTSKGAADYIKFSGIGFQMVIIIGAFAYTGYRIDKSAGHKMQWVTAVMALVGVFIALYVVIRSVKS